jgi:hypothetical protein
MKECVVKTLVCPDGVIGLNGYQYLLDKNGEEILFESRESAMSFLMDNGYTMNWIKEWIEFEIIDNKRKESVWDLT